MVFDPAIGLNSTVSLTRLVCRIASGRFAGPLIPAEVCLLETEFAGHFQEYTHILPAFLTHLQNTKSFNQLDASLQTLIRMQSMNAVGWLLKQQIWFKGFLEEFVPTSMPVMLLKGFAFNGMIYTDREPRISGDIDIMVRDQDFGQACMWLESTGRLRTLDRKRRYTRDHLFERGFEIGEPAPGKMPILVEIHRSLTYPVLFRIDIGGCWTRSVPHPGYAGRDIRVLSVEDAVLHLVLHAFRDRVITPRTIVDLYRLITAGNPDPDVLDDRAREWGCRRLYRSCIRYAGNHLAGIEEILKPDALKRENQTGFFTGGLLPSKTGSFQKMMFRWHQMRSLFMADRAWRVLPFLGYQAYLRIMDIVFYLIDCVAGRRSPRTR